MRDAKLDAFQVNETKGGTAIPLEYKKVDAKSEKLALRLAVDAQRKDGANLVIHFGNHELTARLAMHPQRG